MPSTHLSRKNHLLCCWMWLLVVPAVPAVMPCRAIADESQSTWNEARILLISTAGPRSLYTIHGKHNDRSSFSLPASCRQCGIFDCSLGENVIKSILMRVWPAIESVAPRRGRQCRSIARLRGLATVLSRSVVWPLLRPKASTLLVAGHVLLRRLEL